MSSLDVSSATGPDGLSTMLLRSIADVIAIPFFVWRGGLLLLANGLRLGRCIGSLRCIKKANARLLITTVACRLQANSVKQWSGTLVIIFYLNCLVLDLLGHRILLIVSFTVHGLQFY